MIQANDPGALLAAALTYARKGWPVFPIWEVLPSGACACGKSQCDRQGKHPIGSLVPNGRDGATTDERIILQWWQKRPTANIGMATSETVFGLDVDTREGHGLDGAATLAALEAAHGDLPQTFVTRTGSGGYHALYAPPAGAAISIGASKLGPGLDHRGRGGYLVMAPSNHISGGRYEILQDLPLAPLPQWVVDRLAKPKTSDTSLAPLGRTPTPAEIAEAREILRHCCEKIEATPTNAGLGHDTLVQQAYTAGGLWPLSMGERSEALLAAAERRWRRPGHPLSSDTLRQIKGQLKAGASKPMQLGLEARAIEMVAGLPPLEQEVSHDSGGPIEWVYGPQAAEVMSPPNWIVQGLQICPGRPAMLAGYGHSGKTLVAQALLLACAAGKTVWNSFETPRPLVVRHLDHDQGRYATQRRYQRLAQGLGVSLQDLGERFGFASHPKIRLTQKNAVGHYIKASAGADLVLIDALRGATAGADENDSIMRQYVDVLAEASDQLKSTAFLLIHHAGKIAGEDKRTGPRGSSAIYDGCGCVLQIEAKESHEPKEVYQTKSAAEAEGGSIAPFMLSIEHDDSRALYIRYRAFERPQTADEIMNLRKQEVLLWVETHPGSTQNGIILGVKGRREVTIEATKQLLRTKDLIDRAANQHAGSALFTRNNDRGTLV